MGHPRGKVNRPRVLRAIEEGYLDRWVSAKDVALMINNGYAWVKNSSGHITRRGNIWMTTMSAAVILSEFARKGMLEIKRKNRGDVALYRKVDKTEGHVDTEAKE